MNGDVPTALRISEWGLETFRRRGVWSKLVGTLRMLAISVPLQVLLALPNTSSWEDGDTIDKYTDFPGYQWQWPKHTINPLDQRPQPNINPLNQSPVPRPSSRARIIRPSKLYISDDPPKNLQYVFISYAAASFKIDNSDGKALVRAMAQVAALRAECTAYWVDTDCIDTADSAQRDASIYRMCNVIRGSKKVIIILPDNSVEARKTWGSRMWTLPEALLAPGSEITFLARVEDEYEERRLSLVEMTGEIWDDSQHAHNQAAEDHSPTRLLAEHFAGELALSRIELFVTARNDDDTPFQSLAQLSLSNDSDRLVERMVSLLHQHPPPDDNFNPFYRLAKADDFSTRLWDIQPTCYIVGIAYEDNTVLLDSCRVMHIRWKGFPRIETVRDSGLAKFLATIFVTAATWWFFHGTWLAITYVPFFSTSFASDINSSIGWVIASFFFSAAFLSLLGPVSVRRLYGGEVLESDSSLVGFEGVMPLSKVERLVFGFNKGRLNYEPSSTPIIGADCRDPDRRIGIEPDWVKEDRPKYNKLPEGHRLFTLVDTGSLTVSIFSAERPPTVALLCGREGGMLRAVLCSWQFENNCLFKETVIRMPTGIWDAANHQGWLKVCLTTMNQHGNIERNRQKA
ncbi:hypothetical protein GGS24DRAFT_517910 [Hypoxylon argillaceum]|nr:hypothetical protein GGS24DRAFT_517910 [Hypoxylon argillaceum]